MDDGRAVVAPDFVGLTCMACMGPLSYVPAHAVPHKLVAHKTLGGMDAVVGESMKEVEHPASSIEWDNRPGVACGDVTETHGPIGGNGYILKDKIIDGNA